MCVLSLTLQYQRSGKMCRGPTHAAQATRQAASYLLTTEGRAHDSRARRFQRRKLNFHLSNGKTLTVFLPYDVYKEGFFSTAFHIRCLIHLQAQQQHLADKLCAIHSKSISNEIVSGLLEKHSNSETNMLLESVRPNLPSRTDENPLPSQLPATPRPRPQAPGAGTWQQLWLRRAPAATWRLLPPRGAGGPHCPFINNRRSPS